MPLPRLKLTPAELAEQRHKAQRKRLRKIPKLEDEFVQGPSKRMLYSEGVGHVDELDMTDQELENIGRFDEEQQRDERNLQLHEYETSLDIPYRNEAGRIPRRWRSTSSTPQTNSDISMMDEATYKEWLNQGLYKMGKTVQVGSMNVLFTDYEAMRRKKASLEEYEKKQKEKEERRMREKEERREQRRREKAEEEDRKRQTIQREQQRKDDALQHYEERWKVLLSSHHPDRPPAMSLMFSDIPWPSFSPPPLPSDLTLSAIRTFLFNLPTGDIDSEKPPTLRDILRPHFLRFHPDKFEGKIMPLVVMSEEEREKVQEGVGAVMRCLNEIASGARS